MNDTVWLIVVSAMLSVIGTLALLGYHDLRKQMREQQSTLRSTKHIRREALGLK